MRFLANIRIKKKYDEKWLVCQKIAESIQKNGYSLMELGCGGLSCTNTLNHCYFSKDQLTI